MTDLPKNLKYNKEYSWVKIEEDIATIGVIKPLGEMTGEFVFLELPKKGDTVKKGEKYLGLEAAKWTGEINSPLTGEITDVNMSVFDEPKKLNDEPYKEWIIKLKISNPDETKELLSAEEAGKQDWKKQG